MTYLTKSPLTVLRLKAVMARTGLSKSTIYELGDPGHPRYDASFPKRFQLTPGAVGWVEQEVMDWLEGRIAQARASTPVRSGDTVSEGVAQFVTLPVIPVVSGVTASAAAQS